MKELDYQFQRIDISINHVGYMDPALQNQKLERNVRILEMERAENLDNIAVLKHILFHLGRTYRGMGRFADALPIMQKALEITSSEDPYYLMLYPELISIYTALDRWEEALDACEKGIALSPKDGNLLFRKSLIWDKLGDISKAQECLLKLLEPEAHFFISDLGLYAGKIRHNLGVYYFKQGNYKEAEKQFKTVLKENPHFALSWVALTDLWISQKRWKEVQGAIYRLENELHEIELASQIKALLKDKL